MALIKCNSCGHMISDKATKCPKCGSPVVRQTIQEPYRWQEKTQESASGSKNYLLYILGAVVILGIVGFFLFNPFFSQSPNEDIVTNPVAIDSISANVDSAERSSKEEITKSLEKLFYDVMKGDSHEYDERYFSSDFNRIYKEVDVIDKRFAQEGLIGFWDFGFWDMAQDEVKMNIALNDVYNIEDNEATAKVTFKFAFGEDTKTKNEEIRVIHENGKWVLDDVHGYKKQMKEFVEENKDISKENDHVGGINCSLTGEISTIQNVSMVLRGNKGTLTYVMDGKQILSDIVLDDKASSIDKNGFGHLVLKSFTKDGKLKGSFIGEMDSAECGFLYEGKFVSVNGGSTTFLLAEE